MRSAIDFDHDAGLKEFSDIVMEILNNTLESVIKTAPAVMIQDAVHGTPDDLLEGYDNGTIITATEGKTGFEVGLIFNTRHLTAIADMMLLGDGEAKDELDNDLRDAVVELANQFFGALTAAVDSRMGKKLQFKVENAEKLQSTSGFQSNAYSLFDMKGELNGAPIQFRFYADENISSILVSPAVSQPMPDFFTPTMGEPGKPTPANSPNMDMLLDIDMPVSVRMGSAKLFLKDILGLGPGNIVELDQNADDSIELAVNDKLIARGEVVIVDGYFGFRIKEIISKAERIKKLKD